VDFFAKINLGEHLAMENVMAVGTDLARFFYFNAAESLAWRGFRATDFAKSCYQRT